MTEKRGMEQAPRVDPPPRPDRLPKPPPPSRGEPENAQKWEAAAHIDDNTCKPCKDNDGKLYRNRQAAYRDYPNNEGYKRCVGAQYGNKCRCRVKKRGRGGKNVRRDLAALTDRARALLAGTPAEQPKNLPAIPGMPALENALRTQPAARDGDRNALYIYNSIGGWGGIQALDVATALADMSGPVDVHLNSPGGFIFEGTAIYNAFKAYAGPVTMHIDGYAASAASFIAMAADPYEDGEGGIRIASNALMMIHDGWGGAVGTAEDLRDVADLLDMLSDTIAATYAQRAGGDAATWRETMQEGDTWYNAAAAKKAGLADIITGEADPVEPEPDEDEESESSNVISLDQLFAADRILAPVARIGQDGPEPIVSLNGAKIPNPDPTPDSDFVGFINALKGAFT